MKKHLFLSAFAAFAAAVSAHASGELVATGADVRTWRLGAADGVALSDQSVGVSRTICPWRLYVTNAVKRAQSTQSVFTPTNYVVTATFVSTNAAPDVTNFTAAVTNVALLRDWSSTNVVFSTNRLARTSKIRLQSVSDFVVTATSTNVVGSLDGLSPAWACIATNGVTSVVTNYTTAAAAGTVTLKNSFGDTWSVSLSGGAGSTTNALDLSKLVFPGDLSLTATEAEKLDLRIVYMTFAK